MAGIPITACTAIVSIIKDISTLPGIVVTLIGFLIFQWSAWALSYPPNQRAKIFEHPITTVIMQMIWIGFIFWGLFMCWKSKPFIIAVVVNLLGIICLWIIEKHSTSNRSKINRMLRIYKYLKDFRPLEEEKVLLEETARIYLQNNKIWGRYRAEIIKIEDIKTLIRTIVSWEGTPEYEYHDVKSRVDRFMSSDVGVVDEIYRKETGETTIEKPKPRLSRSTLRKLNKAGLNRENMSNEQLAAIKKLIEGTRVTKIINYFSFASLLITVLMLYLRRWELVIALFLISY